MRKYITGYEGVYSISADGRVYSHISDKIRKTKVNNSGYEMISLYKEGKERTLLVHRLVAKKFCEGFKDGLVVNHKDSNKLNNNSSNLEWISQKENIRDNMDRRRGYVPHNNGPGNTFNALKISRGPSLLKPITLLYTGAGVDEEVIKEELTFTKAELAGITTESLEEDV